MVRVSRPVGASERPDNTWERATEWNRELGSLERKDGPTDGRVVGASDGKSEHRTRRTGEREGGCGFRERANATCQRHGAQDRSSDESASAATCETLGSGA